MGKIVPTEGKEWILLVAGFVIGWYIIGHAQTTGSKTPPGMAG